MLNIKHKLQNTEHNPPCLLSSNKQNTEHNLSCPLSSNKQNPTKRQPKGLTPANFPKRNSGGYTIIELMVYISLFTVAAGLLTAILVMMIRAQNREIALAAVGQELNLVLETTQRLVRDSSLIEKTYEYNPNNPTNEDLACANFCALKLRMEDETKDPTCIVSAIDGVKISEGPDPTNKEKCNLGNITPLTSSQTTVNNLKFTKYDISGGHATVQIDASLTFNSTNQELAVTRSLRSAVGRTSAATFDSNLDPNTTDSLNIGSDILRWQSVSIKRLLNLGTSAVDIGSPVAGSIYYNMASKKLRVYDGSDWGDASSQWITTGNDIYYNTGKVGIGTAAPNNKLDIKGMLEVGAASRGMFLSSSASDNFQIRTFTNTPNPNFNIGVGDGAGGWAHNVISWNNFLDFRGNGTADPAHMRITSTGNVGIGTTAPGELLSLGLAGTTKGVLSLAGNTSGKIIIQPAAVAGTYTLTLPTAQGAAGTNLQNDGAGNLSWAAASSGSKFGGTGVDGAFSISSGTTTLDLGGLAYVVKNYTSISITGTGQLAFINPHANGTIIILKSKGDVTITSTANPAITANGMGAGGGVAGSSGVQASGVKGGGGGAGVKTAGSNGQGSGLQPYYGNGGNNGQGNVLLGDVQGGQYGTPSPLGGATIGLNEAKYGIVALKAFGVPGGGGGSGGAADWAWGVAGARGGGVIYIECNGSLNFTGSINATGLNGATAVTANGSGAGGGGGGVIQIIYNNLTANTGTLNVGGGTGGAGGSNNPLGIGGSGGNGCAPVTQNTEF